jgi:hypothetical protein
MDRARAETAAVEAEFPGAYICYCQMHIFRNIQQQCGKDSELATDFWPAMRGTEQAQFDYRDLLIETHRRIHNRQGKQKMANCIQLLLESWDHWATCCTEVYTRMRTTGRNEGFNGNVKNFVDHRQMTLDYAANAWRLVGEIAFRRSQQMRTCFIPFGILSREDQRFIGSIALGLIHKEMKDLLVFFRFDHIKNVDYSGHCCLPLHDCYAGLPCRHLLRDRYREANSHAALRDYLADDFKGQPLLTRKDIPAQCLRVLSCLRCTGRAPPRPIPASAPSDFDPLEATRDFETLLKVCEHSEEARRAWHTFRHAIDHLISNVDDLADEPDDTLDDPEHLADEPDGTVHDPPRRRIAGQPFVTPSKNSALSYLKGK